MLKLSKNEFRALQKAELEILKEADRICRKHGIPYVIIAGTLLGAVRHRGFIPWDDDTDIALLRKDYERFRRVCREELRDRPFYFQDDRRTRGYRWGYGKLRMANTVFRREHQEHMPYEQGISIDVFPLDGVPDSAFLRLIKNAECFVVRKLLWSEAGRIAERDPAKRLVYRILSRIPEKAVLKYYHGMIRRAGKSTKYVRILMFPTRNRVYGYKRAWYENSAEMEFEGCIFRGIAQYEEYLRFKFGNYLKYPPRKERERMQHPVSAFKLPGDDRCERFLQTNSTGSCRENGPSFSERVLPRTFSAEVCRIFRVSGIFL